MQSVFQITKDRSLWLMSNRGDRFAANTKRKRLVSKDRKDHLHSLSHTINDSDPKSAEVRTSPPEPKPCSTGTFANFRNPRTPTNAQKRPSQDWGQGSGSNPASPTKQNLGFMPRFCFVWSLLRRIRRGRSPRRQRLPPSRRNGNLGFWLLTNAHP